MTATEQLIKDYYDSFNQRDLKKFLNCLSDDVVHDINQGTSQTGKEAFASFMEHMDRCYQETVNDLVILVNQDGTRAAAEFLIEGIYKETDNGLPVATGQYYKLPVGAFFTIKEGKITRVSNYYNLNDWLQQIGNPK